MMILSSFSRDHTHTHTHTPHTHTHKDSSLLPQTLKTKIMPGDGLALWGPSLSLSLFVYVCKSALMMEGRRMIPRKERRKEDVAPSVAWPACVCVCVCVCGCGESRGVCVLSLSFVTHPHI